MLNRKIFIMLVIFILSLSVINSLVIVLDSSEIDDVYILENFGQPRHIDFSAERVIREEFITFQYFALQIVNNDGDKDINPLSIKDKAFSLINMKLGNEKGLKEKISNLKYQSLKMVFFKFRTREPFLDSELDFKVKLLNAKGESIAVSSYFQALKVKDYTFGKRIYYEYRWIIEADRKLIERNFNEDEIPGKLIVEFPDGKKMIYSVEL